MNMKCTAQSVGFWLSSQWQAAANYIRTIFHRIIYVRGWKHHCKSWHFKGICN